MKYSEPVYQKAQYQYYGVKKPNPKNSFALNKTERRLRTRYSNLKKSADLTFRINEVKRFEKNSCQMCSSFTI